MVFKDRSEAGEKIADLLIKKISSEDVGRAIVVSLLRGGIIVGDIIARKLNIINLPLVVSKIPSLYNPELAIGALCFNFVYLENNIIKSLSLEQKIIQEQIDKIKDKFSDYLNRFSIKKNIYEKLKNKLVIMVDDGLATGATAKAGALFISSKKPTKLILALPVAPAEFNGNEFDESIIIHKDQNFSSVSQFYEQFPQVEDSNVKKIIQQSNPGQKNPTILREKSKIK